MEKHKCKLCFKRFVNGRALGGHMRSHMMNLPIHKPQQHQLDSVSAASLSFSSTTSSSENDQNLINGGCEDEKGMLLSYMLRENPKKSLRLADQDFSFTGSVILDQDRESETESSRNPTRRRSKRTARPPAAFIPQFQADEDANVEEKANKCDNKVTTEPWTEPEPVSSVHSDTTTEEEVAFCLMMMSRDKWMDDEEEDEYEKEEEEEEEEEDDEYEDIEEVFEEKKSGSNNRVKGKYVCETCNKSFRTYQALGGHRASHKKIKLSAPVSSSANVNNNSTSKELEEKKVHECPVCFRIFSSGQALGGHKRSHMMGSGAAATIATTAVETENIAVAVAKKRKFGEISIDLNLPAPVDDDEVSSQVENF